MKRKRQELVTKLLKFPADWIPAIDKARGETPFSEFVRAAVLAALPASAQAKLSKNPKHGQRVDLQ